MKNYASLAACLIVSGCAANAINPNAMQVRILDKAPDEKCRYLGEAMGSQGNFFTGSYTTDANLQRGALNDLKNQAADMGGNAVVLVANRGGQTSGTQTNVTAVGNVYMCPL